MKSPKVSILIPVFNRQDFIAECIQSALSQSFEDFEVVVIDNASNDRTWEICQEFSNIDPRVRVFRNDSNIGPVRNWIRCAKEAKGEFSKVLFSDDCLDSDCLSEMAPILEDSEIALVYSAARIGKCRDESVIAYSLKNSSKMSSDQFLKLVLFDEAPVSPGAILIRTSDLIKNLHTEFPTSRHREFDKNGAGPDVMTLLLTSQSYLYVANISRPLVYFRIHADSFTINNLNNDVPKGHTSSIALFLVRNNYHKLWIEYLAKSWLRDIKLFKKWINPISYIVEYEGRGSSLEVIQMTFYAIKRIIKKYILQTPSM